MEFLNTLKISGIPPHILKLKIGAIIILLKNIDSRRGLCNGTRLIVKQLLPNIIAADIATGKNKCNTPVRGLSTRSEGVRILNPKIIFSDFLRFFLFFQIFSDFLDFLGDF
jgi:hypothetical protein